MSAIKRARACDACHSIKIKCELGSSIKDPPCERCLRLGKSCTVSPPIRQKDRVAELEAKVEALTKLLEAQEIRVSLPSVDSTTPELSEKCTSIPSATTPETSNHETSKKRKLQVSLVNGAKTFKDADERMLVKNGSTIELDSVVPQPIQIQILSKYRNEIEPRFSLASLVTTGDYNSLRERYPVLLQVVIYAASPGVLSIDKQDEVAKIVVNLLAPKAITKAKRSMELVQALQLAAFWYSTPRHHVHIPVFQRVQQAAEISEDIGLGGPNCSLSNDLSSSSEPVSAGDAWRSWLACYFHSAYMGACMRIPHPISWSNYLETSLICLDYFTYGLSTDRVLCQFVRAMRVCEQIATKANLNDFNSVVDVADPDTQLSMHGLHNLITDWKAQIPQSLSSPSLKLWEYYATLYIHECVLHTTTNKHSFAAPYLAERLSVTDFPVPIVTQDHLVSIYALRDASHGLLDLFISLDMLTLMSFPPFLFTSQAFYAQWILIKLYISATGPGNSYGAFLDAQSLQVEQYLAKMINTADKVKQIDARCGQARILNSTHRMREWFCAYNESHVKQTAIFTSRNSPGSYLAPGSFGFGESSAINWDSSTSFDDSFEYGLEDLFGYTF